MNLEPALDVGAVSDLQQFGSEWNPVFDGAHDPQTSREWFASTVETALPGDDTPVFVCVRSGGKPVLCCPLIEAPGRVARAMTTPYTCRWTPSYRADLPAERLAEALAGLGRFCRRYAVTRFDALPEEWPDLPAFLAALRASGLRCRTFAHFGNWFIDGLSSWDAYLDGRPGALRETIRRKTRAALRDPQVRIAIYRSPEEIRLGLQAYETIYAQSWKNPEPFPEFAQSMLCRLAGKSAVRLFVFFQGATPVAAQYWTSVNRKATILKLAHTEALGKLSPGTVLTAAAIRHLLEQEDVTEVDFGRGDDGYKQGWTGARRQRLGVVAHHPFRLGGLSTLLRHDAGRIARRFITTFRGSSQRSLYHSPP